MAYVLKIIFLMCLAGTKYLFAVASLYMTSWHWAVDYLIATAGGFSGVFVFTILAEKLSAYLSRFERFRYKFKSKRRFIKLRKGYGLMGIALLSPVMLSIPLGCLLSVAFENQKQKIIIYQCISILLWGFLFFGLKGLFNINLAEYFGIK